MIWSNGRAGSIRDALALIDDLIEVARPVAGHIEIAHGPLRVEPVIEELVEEHSSVAVLREIVLGWNSPTDLPLVESDPRRLHQVLGNVLSNAIKYTPRGGAVDVLAECCDRPGSGPGEWVRITVQDNGPGIPVEQQGLLFQEYTRLGPDVAEGSGLGLAISRRIALGTRRRPDLSQRTRHRLCLHSMAAPRRRSKIVS